MMVLLLHLTTCGNLDFEETSKTRLLLDQNFELVGDRMSQGRVVSSSANAEESKGRSEKAHLIYSLLAKRKTRTYERAGWHSAHDNSSDSCPVRNFSPAIEKATVPLRPEIMANGNDSEAVVPDGYQDVPAVPMDTTDWEEWGGLVEEFLQPDMIG